MGVLMVNVHYLRFTIRFVLGPLILRNCQRLFEEPQILGEGSDHQAPDFTERMLICLRFTSYEAPAQNPSSLASLVVASWVQINIGSM